VKLKDGGETMTEPVIAQRSPYPVDVQAGRTYYWCACGKSARQPFCDGSHKGSEFTPIAYTADQTARVWFCGCKHSAQKPLCDGSHSKL
jgi:CDGSH iron-sulfur domain-containing protein 3